MEEFFSAYGYIALLVGSFLEGETALLIASILVHKGFFYFPYVVVVAWCGGMISDLVYFSLGRNRGTTYLLQRPILKRRAEQLRDFAAAHRYLLLFSYRFLYGFRIVLPLIIGMSKIPTREFLFFSFVSGLIWASLIGASGYGLGIWLEAKFNLDDHLIWILLACAVFGLSMGLIVKTVFQSKVIKS